ncbi:MAG: alpha/beta hydrolase [Chromatiales bacterium]|nr:alpha/beta hydrolase [Chromatiales bacterium]
MPRVFIAAIVLGLLLAPVSLSAKEVRVGLHDVVLNANLEQNDAWPAGPVLLLTHGTLAHRDMEIIRGLQRMFKERGLSSLAINLSLGLNDRAAAMYDCPTPHTHKHTDAVGEIGAWVQWLKGEGVDKIALLGHSRGGNQTARYAAGHQDEAIVGVILLAPATWDEGTTAPYYAKRYGQPLEPLLEKAHEKVDAGKGDELMGPMGFIYCEDTRASAEAVVSYYREDPDFDTPRLLKRIQAPVVVFAGSEDTVVAGLAEKTEAIADGEHIKLEVMDGADHFFRDLYSEDIADYVVEMLD